MTSQQTSLTWLKKLIVFDTTSRNSNLSLITAIQEWLASHKIESQLIYDETGKKANLLATLPCRKGSKNGGLMLSGHTDVVPVDGQEWYTDPFQATQIEDRIYGRGTCDMKGFIAVVLALVPEFKKMKLTKPIHFAFSYDEEVGCLGAPSIVKTLQKNNIQPSACIVGEPTEMHPAIAHKGINAFHCKVHGNAKHSSMTNEGCNAIEYAAQLITKIRQYADQLRTKGQQDKGFTIPFTSMTVNQIQGGTAVNIIPNLCEFAFEFRNLPSVQPQEIIAKIQNYIAETQVAMKQEFPLAKIELNEVASPPAFEASPDAAFTKLVSTLTGENKALKLAFATEAGLFQQMNIPTIVCGPGSIEQAHRPNEFITLDQITKCEKFLVELARSQV